MTTPFSSPNVPPANVSDDFLSPEGNSPAKLSEPDAYPEPLTPFERLVHVTGCRSNAEISALLSVPQAAVAEARRKGGVPAKWLVKLLRLRCVNPEWIIAGMGTVFLRPDPDAEKERPARHGAVSGPIGEAGILRDVLDCFPGSMLSAALNRKKTN